MISNPLAIWQHTSSNTNNTQTFGLEAKLHTYQTISLHSYVHTYIHNTYITTLYDRQ